MNISYRNRITQIAFLVIFPCLIFACRTAEMAVHQDLKTKAESYVVKGRQGWQVGQTLSFGPFMTSKIQHGWTFSYSLPFIVRFNGTSEKLHFAQFDGNNRAADVAVISKFRETELRQLEAYFSVSLRYRNYCAGTVKSRDSETAWDFLIHDVDGAERIPGKNSTVGFVRNGDTSIEITGIRELEGSHSMLTRGDVYGYEFYSNGQIIAALSTVNEGKMWFAQGLNADLKLVLAGVSSGLMLRKPRQDDALSLK